MAKGQWLGPTLANPKGGFVCALPCPARGGSGQGLKGQVWP